jgi:hypothetical protein
VRALIAGDFEDAESVVSRAEANPTDRVVVRINAMLGRVQIEHLRGHWREAELRWGQEKIRLPEMMAPYMGYEGLVGDIEEVRQSWNSWSARRSQLPDWTTPANVGVGAEAIRRLGDRDAAAALGSEFAGYAGKYFTNGNAWFYGPYDTALGTLAATAGDLDAAVVHLTNAVAQCDRISSPTFGAIARLELATVLRNRATIGDDMLASTASAEARRMMTEVGMPGWLRRLDLLDSGDLEPWKLVDWE